MFTAGCVHGELNQLYASARAYEKEKKVKIDLVLCCGDFQSVRNKYDMGCMSCPDKYK